MFRYNLPEKFRVLDGSALKIIACVTMLIDHAAVCLIFNSILMPNAPIIQGTLLQGTPCNRPNGIPDLLLSFD